jgi:RNA polymerase sigma-70 factor (ECF subfamily)
VPQHNFPSGSLLTIAGVPGFQTEERMTVASVSGKTFSLEFEQIFQEHHDLVYRTAYGITGYVEDAEDVAQTIFLRILRREVPVASMANPAGYLYRAAVNLSLTIVKSRTRVGDVGALSVLPSAATNNVEEQHRALYETIATLPPRMAEILILRYQHNFSDAQISKLLGTSRGVIAVTPYRARARLKKLLAGSSGAH